MTGWARRFSAGAVARRCIGAAPVTDVERQAVAHGNAERLLKLTS
ncbi:hypothetical protein [Amycolatopsis sp. NPDC051102]